MILLYLDQNFVSNIAKARLGRKGYELFFELFLVLKDLVTDKRVRCPASYFHFVETDVDLRLADEIKWVVGYLSAGLSFLHWEEVFKRQLINGFYKFVSGEQKYEGYEEAFMYTEGNRWDKIYPLHEQKELKLVKKNYVLKMEKLKALPVNTTLYDLISQNKDRVISEYASKLLAFVDDERIEEYLKSFAIRNVPFIDIFASLDACFILYDGNRHPRGSDQIDLLMTSTVLPYIDIFATDRYIKNNVTVKLHFDKKYDVKVFSGRVDDVKRLIRVLCSMLAR